MGHLNHHSYGRMAQRLGQYVPGAFVSATLVEILKQLVTEEEAQLCSLMPLRTVPAEKMARVWGMDAEEARAVLDRLAGKGVVYAFAGDSGTAYGLAPPVLGFVEFSLMRTDGKLDAKRLSELYYQYCQVEGDFVRQHGAISSPAFTRVYAGEDVLEDVAAEVLSYDRVSVGIETATCITVGLCYCRHKMEHMGQACNAPQEVCLTFNEVARYLADYGIAKEISKEEARRIVKECMNEGLVQIGDNTRSGLAVICNCCGCCCDLLLGYRRFGSSGLISPSAFLAAIDQNICTSCGICAKRCPAGAIDTAGDKPMVKPKVCLGCGVCARFCPNDSCHMYPRTPRPYIPKDSIEKILVSAVHAGKLGNYLFDNQTSQLHALLRRAVNAAVIFPPIKSLLLSKLVQSTMFRFLRAGKRC
ncbi:ATP-binding protein [Candidatus Electronema sp. PJ]|uniref:ATP-binding protein n=1 Tax=Candidatus Electronema sp. PJ TaxID=3401572 RepID=UPI003AA83EB8